MPTLNFATIKPAQRAEWQQSFIQIPVFSYLNASVWQGNSKVITQFNYSTTKNFTIKALPTKPTTPTFCPVIRYRVGNISYRYKLWFGVGEGINCPPYRGEVIKKNFVIEIWDVNGQTSLVNTAAINIPLSIRRVPTTSFADILTPYEEASSSEVSQQASIGPNISAPPSTGMAIWYKSDADVIQGGGLVSQWNDQSGNGRHLTSAGVNRPSYTAAGDFGEVHAPLIDFSGVKAMIWAGTNFNLANLFIAVAQKSWTLNNIIFSSGGGAITVRQGTSGTSIQGLYGAANQKLPGTVNTFGQTFELYADINSLKAALPYLYINIDPLGASINPSSSIPTQVVIQSVGGSFTIGDTGSAADVTIVEIIGYSSPLSLADELLTLQYLANRYRKGGVFPGGFGIPIQFNNNIQWLDNPS